jgi:hypothetical protein
MSFGLGGSSTHSKSTSTTTSTTPWSDIAKQLAGTLKTNLQSLGGGSSISEGVSAIGDVFKRTTKEGVANIKEAFGKSGLRFSSDVGKAIGDFTTGQTLAQTKEVEQFQQQAVNNQLNALQEIISLASGTGTQTSTGATSGGGFGWNFAMKLIGGQ